MIRNGVKQRWAEGKPVLNGWLSIASSFSAEIMAAQGYDSLTIDLQHGIVGYDGAVPMLQAMRASGVTPLVRVPWLDPADIMKALDAGAYGVICPMINTRAEAECLVSYVRYPPAGVRSFGPSRALFSAGPGYAAEADGEIICLAMIETAQAYENLEDILATPGLDGVYIGPADLTLGLQGKRYAPGFDRREPEMIEAIKTILHAAHRAGKRAALHNGTADYAAEAVGWGFDLVTVSNDVRLLAGAAEASVRAFRERVQQVAPADTIDTGGY
ncbi:MULTISPECIES: HpcH/HpaI aldolase family protein [unclassified Shinella]|uniref:HpcH/HpaI aldolase family protein n=1 Tax=unclassified Shinella TaxID=2643062 RepID=UPI00234F48FE|nr:MULTISPECIES: aldolase/citrate lyase family protein [unclassified Shinella]MCO5154084.1 aldolase/citrate lyase family protein [Shinella sp.]MDC7260886.1 2,4-dihydroxyhept-2-ene-1,7-dioic acid aldolase [Shinella sp. HY16]MDC7267781.1 2,4-dihydroxyhept-2-ene-1,7-dioic acid aldolase [Shinella sp. YZ44]